MSAQLVERLRNEADLCRNDGANDIASLLDEAIAALAAAEVPVEPAPHAMQQLTAALQADPEYAWSWHCNLAMPVMDATGSTHRIANEAGARLMRHLFDIDITKHPHYQVEAAANVSKSVQKRLAVQTAQPVPLTPAEIDAVICAAYAFVAKRGAGNREHAIARFTEQAHRIGSKP